MRCISRVSPLTRFSLSLVSYRPLARMGLSRYIRAGVTVRAIGHEMIVPTIGVTLPPDLATRLPGEAQNLWSVPWASPRLGRRGSAFVTVASKVSRDHLTELKGAGSRPSIASGL